MPGAKKKGKQQVVTGNPPETKLANALLSKTGLDQEEDGSQSSSARDGDTSARSQFSDSVTNQSEE